MTDKSEPAATDEQFVKIPASKASEMRDTIAAQRVSIETLEESVSRKGRLLRRASKENERYREALQKVAWDQPWTASTPEQCHEHRAAARAALEGERPVVEIDEHGNLVKTSGSKGEFACTEADMEGFGERPLESEEQ